MPFLVALHGLCISARDRRLRRGHFSRSFAVFAVVLAAGCSAPDSTGEASEPLLVLAASDLQQTLPEVAAAFEAGTGQAIRLVFGSTGSLTTQIEQGAPGDVFLAADEAYLDRLADRGFIRTETRRVYAIGRLAVVWPPAGVGIDRITALTEPRFEAVAIANPEHAPYGRAARESLVSAGIWTRLASRLIVGENVSQAYQFVRSGNADAGIVAHSLVAADGEYLLVPQDLHRPLRQAGSVLRASSRPDAAGGLLDFMMGEEGQQILARHGFGVPSE